MSAYSQAHMEAIFALDFVSLLLSKHTPRSAETSISPHLKQMVPLGSLDVDVIKTPEKPASTQRDVSTVARGWKLDSFNAAASKLLKAASRLENEVAAETKYWNQVLAVKERGWKVCRLPRERQALGVQYGFLEGRFLEFRWIMHVTDGHSYVYFPRPRPCITTASRRWQSGVGPRIGAVPTESRTCAGEEEQPGYWMLEAVAIYDRYR